MLLTEYRPFKVDKQLVEASIRKNKPLLVTGVLQRANAKNQNERVYPKDILAREMRSYMEGPVREKRALGELDHPESSVINLQNVSHNLILHSIELRKQFSHPQGFHQTDKLGQTNQGEFDRFH